MGVLRILAWHTGGTVENARGMMTLVLLFVCLSSGLRKGLMLGSGPWLKGGFLEDQVCVRGVCVCDCVGGEDRNGLCPLQPSVAKCEEA